MKIVLDDSADKLAESFQRSLDRFIKGSERTMFRALTLLEAQVKQNLRKNYGMKRGTGALLNSFGGSKHLYKDSIGFTFAGEIGSEGVPYAVIQEEGGTIRAKDKKALTIPTKENRQRDGSPKITTRDLANNLTKSFVAKGIIFGLFGNNKGKSRFQEAIPLFILKQSVDIPAHKYFANAVDDKEAEIWDLFGALFDKSFE